MIARFHTIVAGLGAMGSAALYQLGARGVKAAGFDRYAPPHDLGSSHGETRMIREAYFEHPSYVPLVRRAYDLWHDLSARTAERLITETGGVFAGPPDGAMVSGIRQSGAEHGIAVETLTPVEAVRRCPWLHFDDGMEIVSEPRAGFVRPEHCIQHHLELAAQQGASIHPDEPVESWRAERDGVIVTTERGEYAADRLILATGAWMVETLASLGVTAEVARQPLFWFEPQREALLPATVWAVEFEPGKLLYGFPAGEAGMKMAIHHGGAPRVSPREIDRTVHDEDVQPVRELAERYLPGVTGKLARAEVCMYTNTPDQHFIFDAHPDHPAVLVVSACSGHGFKFSSAIGEAAAQWARGGAPALDLSLFSLRRFA